jgi:hypothetical protein
MPEMPDRAPKPPAAPAGAYEEAAFGLTPPPTPRRPDRKTVFAAAAGLVAGLVLGVAGTLIAGSAAGAKDSSASAPTSAPASATEAPVSALKNAAKTCVVMPPDATLGDGDKSLSLDSHGKEQFGGLSETDLRCVLDAVKTPDYVRSQMSQTRALDGTQHGSWGNISASWTYHPDSGLDVVLTEGPAK